MIPRVLSIAGSDSAGGAGIQADIKTITMLGGHAMTAITAITAQNTLGVNAIQLIPTEMVLAQIDAVFGDIGVDAVKIGMIGSADTAIAVADRLYDLHAGREMVPIVFDPVMVATSGAILADTATIRAFGRLMNLAVLITPNIPELVTLSGLADDIAIGDDLLVESAIGIVREAQAGLLIKGGHGEGPMVVDRLVGWNGVVAEWTSERINTRHSHGTGCTLASAIATSIGAGLEVPEAIERARAFVRSAMLASPGFGHGNGPMGHALGSIPADRI